MGVTPDNIVNYMQSYYPKTQKWSKENLLGWVCWLIENNLVYCVFDKEEFAGMCIVRGIDNGVNTDNHYYHNEQSPNLWVEFLICLKPTSLKYITKFFRERFPQAKSIFYRRGKNNQFRAMVAQKLCDRMKLSSKKDTNIYG